MSSKKLRTIQKNEIIAQNDLENHPNNVFLYNFTDVFTKYRCKILRDSYLGYRADVFVPKSHSLYSKDTECNGDETINVHGFVGLRFEDGKFPMDFFQSDDYVLACPETHDKKYWTFENVKAEVIEMARQLYELK